MLLAEFDVYSYGSKSLNSDVIAATANAEIITIHNEPLNASRRPRYCFTIPQGTRPNLSGRTLRQQRGLP